MSKIIYLVGELPYSSEIEEFGQKFCFCLVKFLGLLIAELGAIPAAAGIGIVHN
jgi:hypothetical protein